MRIKSLVELFDRWFPKPKELTEKEKKTLEKVIVSRYAQGNVGLHFGNYLTTDDIAALKNQISSHNFLGYS